MEQGDLRILLITRRTRLQELVARYNTVEQARFQAEHLGMDFGDFLEEDRIYRDAVVATVAALQPYGRLQQLERGFLPNFLFPPGCLVVVLGQDGLVANTLKYLDGQRVLAVNPDPARWEGVLLPFRVGDIAKLLPDVLQQRRQLREIAMARAVLDDGQSLLAVNDLFVGVRNHVSARYEITLDNVTERQSSSGIIISTGLGSTGWLRSILTGAHAVAGQDASADLLAIREHGMAWDSTALIYNVREPYPSKSTETELAFGTIENGRTLRVRSLMPENGVIFSDGMVNDGLDFRSGLVANIGLAPKRGLLLT